MIFLNTQWQGADTTNQTLKKGAEILKTYFNNNTIVEVPQSNQPLTEKDNIKSFYPILENTTAFKALIEKHQPKHTVSFGGDCSIDLMPIAYLNDKYKNDLAIIWIDAHADLHTPESSPSKNFHGMPLRTLIGDGHPEFLKLICSKINQKQICYIGLHDVDPPELEYLAKKRITSLSTCEYEKVGNKLKSYNNVYIHLDLDVLDKREYGHVLLPSENGFKINEVSNLIKAIKANHNVVGMALTESSANSLAALKPITSILDQFKLND